MAEKPDNKPELSSASPSFKTDGNLEKAFMSILFQDACPGKASPEEGSGPDDTPSDAGSGAVMKNAVPSPDENAAAEEPVKTENGVSPAEEISAVAPEVPPSGAETVSPAPAPVSIPVTGRKRRRTRFVPAKKQEKDEVPVSSEETASEPEPVSVPEVLPESGTVPESAAGIAPFMRTSERISSFAVDLFIAALPILGARIWYFGWRTVTVLLTALLVSLFSELVFALFVRKDPPSALKDRNFAVTALTVTLISSPNLPLWAIAVLCALAVLLFRGVLGLRTSSVRSHPLNPAMAAFSLLLLLWNGLDRFGAAPGVRVPLLLASPDPAAYGVGNPILASLREGVLPSDPLVSLVFGNAAGLLPVLFVLIALVYLLVRKAVPYQVPCAMLVSGILFAALLPRTAIRTDMILLQSVLFEICSGTFLLCALLCGADTATVPYTGTGKIVFGFLAGAFTLLLRHYTGIVNCAPIGVVAANALTPLINRFTVPRPFGGK